MTGLWCEFKGPNEQPERLRGLDLHTDPIRGLPALADEPREILVFTGNFVRSRGWHIPVVTEIGRLPEDQEALYFQTELQRIEAVATNGKAVELARRLARERPSLHRVDIDGKARAYDLRSWNYTEAQRNEIIAAVAQRFPRAKVLHHQVLGEGWHFHFGVPRRRRK